MSNFKLNIVVVVVTGYCSNWHILNELMVILIILAIITEIIILILIIINTYRYNSTGKILCKY